MPDLGPIGYRLRVRQAVPMPRVRARYGALQISATVTIDESPAEARVDVFDRAMQSKIMTVHSRADGTLLAPNLAAGRYHIVVNGLQKNLPGIHVVDVS